MNGKQVFRLSHSEARRRAAQCIADAPDGWVVVVREPTRSLDQNALLWVLLTAFSEQLEWPVNGEKVKLAPDEWKDLLTGAFGEDTRIAKGLNGGMVILGTRTSQMGKRRFAEFIEFIQSVAADRGVRLTSLEIPA